MACPLRFGVLAMLVVTAAHAQPGGAPNTSLYDTGAASARALTGAEIEKKSGWTIVPEDMVAHAFKGDAIFLNDRLALVLRAKAGGADLYSSDRNGWKFRATVATADAATLSSVKIVENSSAAVMVEATFNGKSGEAVAKFRLTAGDILLEVRGGSADGKLSIADRGEYLVVPDFFADDLVYDPAAMKAQRVGLPTENAVLSLGDSGQAVVACVWQSPLQSARAYFADANGKRALSRYEIDLHKGKSVWVAVLDGPGIWWKAEGDDKELEAKVAKEWKAPFPAKWRVDFVASGGMSNSFVLADASERGTTRAECWLDAGGALVRTGARSVSGSARTALIYPIDRSRATPLNSFCFVDVLRNSLGVGPCQYVLDAEGIALKDNPTPDQVSKWMEKQLEKKKSKRDADAMREQLAQMVLQVKRTEQRLDEYREAWREMGRIVSVPQLDADAVESLKPTLAMIESMSRATAATQPVQVVEELAKQAGGLVESDDALAAFGPIGERIRAIGADQNYRLARFRMAGRRLMQECAALAENPGTAGVALRLKTQIERMIRKK